MKKKIFKLQLRFWMSEFNSLVLYQMIRSCITIKSRQLRHSYLQNRTKQQVLKCRVQISNATGVFQRINLVDVFDQQLGLETIEHRQRTKVSLPPDKMETTTTFFKQLSRLVKALPFAVFGKNLNKVSLKKGERKKCVCEYLERMLGLYWIVSLLIFLFGAVLTVPNKFRWDNKKTFALSNIF